MKTGEAGATAREKLGQTRCARYSPPCTATIPTINPNGRHDMAGAVPSDTGENGKAGKGDNGKLGKHHGGNLHGNAKAKSTGKHANGGGKGGKK